MEQLPKSASLGRGRRRPLYIRWHGWWQVTNTTRRIVLDGSRRMSVFDSQRIRVLAILGSRQLNTCGLAHIRTRSTTINGLVTYMSEPSVRYVLGSKPHLHSSKN